MGVDKWSSYLNKTVGVTPLDPNILSEDEWGHCSGTSTLFYPRISSCCGLAIQLSNNTLVGAHFTSSADAAEFQALLDLMNNHRHRTPQDITGMFFFGALAAWTPAQVKAPGYHWASMIKLICNRFGYTKTFSLPARSERHRYLESVYYYDQGLDAENDYMLSIVNNAASLENTKYIPKLKFDPNPKIKWKQVQLRRLRGPWFGEDRGT